LYRYSITPQIERDVTWLDIAHHRLSRPGVLPRRWVGRLRRELQANSVAASSRMEGVRVDADQTRRILAGDRPQSVTPRDAALVEGYRDALALALSQVRKPGFVWSSRFVREVHASAMAASSLAGPGSFREEPVYVVDGQRVVMYAAPSSALVPQQTDELCEWLNENRAEPAPVVAALTHARIAGIHPFADGNGRTARILATAAMVQGGFVLPEFTNLEEWWGDHQRSYYRAFECLGSDWRPRANVTTFVAVHVRAQRRQVSALTERLAVERHVWTALEDITAEDVGLRPRAAEALFDAFLGRSITNRYYRGIVDASVATATNDLGALQEAGLLEAVGAGRSRSYVGTFRLIALVAAAAGAPVLAEPAATLAAHRDVVLDDLRAQLATVG